MQLFSLMIEGFRKHLDNEIFFSDSTFLIGENNVGKSSILYALDYLLGVNSTIPLEEFYALEEDGVKRIAVDNIIFTAEFHKIPNEANSWRGFKGRILKYEHLNKDLIMKVKSFTLYKMFNVFMVIMPSFCQQNSSKINGNNGICRMKIQNIVLK